MKKKGFTLIELLAVIVILAIIALIITPVIKDLIESSRYASAVDSVLSYVAGANTQAAADVGIGGFEGFSLDLSNNNRLETGITDDELAKIKFKGKGPTYVYLHFTDDSKLVSDGHFCIWNYSIDYRMDTGASKSVGNNYCTGEIIVKEHYDIGEPIYYNVTTGKQCSEDAFLANVDEWGSHANFTYIDGKLITRSLEAMPTGLHSGCMKFYTLKDDGDNLTVIAASNIDEVGPDKYETDPNKFGERYVLWADIKTGAENQNVKDFNNITNSQSNTLYVLDTLKEYTKDWNVLPVSEDYISTFDNDGTEDSYTIPYKTEGYKARLITKKELDDIYDMYRNENDTYGRASDEVLFLGDYLDGTKHAFVYSKNGSSIDSRAVSGYYTSDAMNSNNMYVYTKNSQMWYKCDGKWINTYSCSQEEERKYFPYYVVDGRPTTSIYGIRPIVTISKEKLSDKEIYYAVPNIQNTDVAYKKYESGTILYYNVTTGTECTKAEADNNLSYRHTPVEVKTGCMKFYTLKDSEYSDRVSLLLDHPITYTPVAWNENVGGKTYFEAVTLLNRIKLDIDGWQGLEEIDNYTTEGLQGSYNTEYIYRQTIPFKDYGVKARLIKAEEYDEVLHKTTAYHNSFRNDLTSVAEYESLYSPMGSYSYCNQTSPNNSYYSYDEKCNPYGTLGYNISEISWLYADYQRNYSAGDNEPSSEYLDLYDGYGVSLNQGYAGGYWGMDMTKSNRGYGQGIMFMIDSPRWYDSGPHLYRPVIEVKKDKFGSVTQKDSIEITIDETTNFATNLSNPIYSIGDTTVATIDSNGTIIGKKIGVTQVEVTNGTNKEYAKLVVNHKPYTYYKTPKYALYNLLTGAECNSSEAACSSYSNCQQFQVIGETDNGNYILIGNAPYDYSADKGWQARYAIDDDPNAETKYGEMAYSHWYKTMEWVANQTKNWIAETPIDYIDYTTKEYVIPWSKPAYYENGSPVYAKAKVLNLEIVNGMYQNRINTNGIWDNVYEELHDIATTGGVIYRGQPIIENTVGVPVKGYFTNGWSSGRRNANISYFVIEVSKSRINNLMDDLYSNYPSVFRSMEENAFLSNDAYTWTQNSTDGGEVDIILKPRTCYYNWCTDNYYAYPKTNGHVHLIGTPTGNGDTIEKDITVDIQYSCGQVDMCGRTTPSCDMNEGDPINTDPTTPGTMTSSTATSGSDTTPPVCVLERVIQLTNGIQPVLTCTDETSEPTIRSQWNVRPVGANQFSDIGIVKNGTATAISGGGYKKTVQPQWTISDPISIPSYRDCYYFRYGAQDAAGNWSFYISDKCYYGFSNINANRKTN